MSAGHERHDDLHARPDGLDAAPWRPWEDDSCSHFEGMPYSHQLRYVLSIEGAKTAETRQQRITKAVSMLRDGRAWGRQ